MIYPFNGQYYSTMFDSIVMNTAKLPGNLPDRVLFIEIYIVVLDVSEANISHTKWDL